MSTQKNEHNPSKLTAMQIGKGFRLLCVGERFEKGDELWSTLKRTWVTSLNYHDPNHPPLHPSHPTYRRRITPPTDTTGSGREGETPEINYPCIVDGKHLSALVMCMDAILRKPDDERRKESYQKLRSIVLAENEKGGIAHKQLERQVEALRRDGERLDWLETKKLEMPGCWTGDKYSTYWRNPYVEWSLKHSVTHGTYNMPKELCELTLRAAIDSAQRQEAR